MLDEQHDHASIFLLHLVDDTIVANTIAITTAERSLEPLDVGMSVRIRLKLLEAAVKPLLERLLRAFIEPEAELVSRTLCKLRTFAGGARPR